VTSYGTKIGYWRDMVAAAYEDLPGLSLTLAQAQRLWHIDDERSCRTVLDTFVKAGYLQCTEGRYRRADQPAAKESVAVSGRRYR
jgi:hypothetical protein